jgi:hypothetical protein
VAPCIYIYILVVLTHIDSFVDHYQWLQSCAPMANVRDALEEQVQACRAFVTDALPDYIHVTTMPLV